MNLRWPWARRIWKKDEAPEKSARSPSLENPTLENPKDGLVKSGLVLRKFDFAADADAVCGFQEETYQLNFPDFRYTPAFSQAFRYDLRRSSLDPEHGLFVLREKGEEETAAVVGFLWIVIVQNNWLGERYGYINNVYIAPDWRGRGLARELIEHGEKYLRSHGVEELRLTVTKSNASAVALYRACGYEVARWEMGKKL